MKRGRLVAFEGIDGCGKSTQLARAAEALRRSGHDVVETREPTDGPTGQRIRDMARSDEPVTPREELRWFVEDRREHVTQVIEPALAAGQLVLTDRYTLSSAAYQGARGLEHLAILEQGERDFPVPDLVLLFEIDPAAALRRVDHRGATAEPVFERLDFLADAAALFATLERPYIERIDAEADPDTVHERVMEALARRAIS